MNVALGTRTRFLIGEHRSTLLADITISNISSHFNSPVLVESPRIYRRLQNLRGWSHEQSIEHGLLPVDDFDAFLFESLQDRQFHQVHAKRLPVDAVVNQHLLD